MFYVLCSLSALEATTGRHAPYSAQGQTIGQTLLDRAKQLAKKQNAHYLWLGVWEHNPSAIRFYERNGFQKFGEHPFILGKDIQNDFLMRLGIGCG